MKKLLVIALIAALIVPAISLVSAQEETVTIRFTFWIPTDHAAAVAAFNPLAESCSGCTAGSMVIEWKLKSC